MSGTGHSTKNISATGDQTIDGVLKGIAWNGGSITFSFPASNAEYTYSGEPDSFGTISTAQENMVRATLDTAYGNSANDGFSVEGFTNLSISFTAATNANLRYGESDDPSTAWAYYPFTGNDGGDVWFGTTYNYRAPEVGTYESHTLIHETGHALGLKHGHDTSGNGALPAFYDRMEYSVMTYRSYQGQSTSGGYGNEHYGFAQTYMMSDIAALQTMYGANFSTNSGNTVYKWNPNSGDTLVNGAIGIDAVGDPIFATIWDGGGIDTYDLSSYTTDLQLDLRPGQFSTFDINSNAQLAFLGDGHYAQGQIYNAFQYQGDARSLIEKAIGGSGNDNIGGNSADNTLQGSAGDDTLYGANGADILDGGAGEDTAYYGFEFTNNLTVDLAAPGNNTYEAAGDTYISIENLTGGNGNDSLRGTNGDNVIDGRDGNDVFLGRGGNDSYYGGLGDDIFYVQQAGDLVVEMANEGYDRVRVYFDNYVLPDNVEALYLNGAANVGTGNVGNNMLVGGSGNDTLYGVGGDDIFIGGAGNDIFHGGLGDDLFYIHQIGDSIVEGSGEGKDTIRTNISGYTMDANVEILRLYGSSSLTATGNDTENFMIGTNVVDTFYGAGGDDRFLGGLGNDNYYGGLGDDFFYIQQLGDTVSENSGEGHDTVRTYVNGYTLTANVEDLYLYGGASDGSGNSMDNRLIGANHDDNLNGNDGDDRLYGKNGADTLNGGAGNDRLYGGGGFDTLFGGSGNDLFIDDEGEDRMTGGTGADRFIFYTDSNVLARDTITDFSHAENDRIDLRNIDADTTTAGDQAFSYIGTSAFNSTAGEIRFNSAFHKLELDFNGDGILDRTIYLDGASTPMVSDFLL